MQDDPQLSQHFHLSEFTASQAATRAGLRNVPSNRHVENLRRLAGVMEQVRQLLGQPILISSGYRSPAVNAVVGGALASAHMRGLAADFTSPAFGSPFKICRLIADSAIAFHQLVHEGTWVHLGLSDGEPRTWKREVLTAYFEAGASPRYMRGLIA